MSYDYSDETKKLRDNGYSQDLIDFVCKTDLAWVTIVDELDNMHDSLPPDVDDIRRELDTLRGDLWEQLFDNRAPGAIPTGKPPQEIVVDGHTYQLVEK